MGVLAFTKGCMGEIARTRDHHSTEFFFSRGANDICAPCVYHWDLLIMMDVQV